jgi:hypothetical protein
MERGRRILWQGRKPALLVVPQIQYLQVSVLIAAFCSCANLVYRGHGPQQNYIFCNTRKNAYSDIPVGIGFGYRYSKPLVIKEIKEALM